MPLSRRSFVVGALGAPLVFSLAPAPALAQDAPASAQILGVQRFMAGGLEVTALLDGHLSIDPAILSNLDAGEAETLLRAAFKKPGPVATGVNAYLVRSADRTVLVDAGGRGAFPTMGRLLDALNEAGAAPDAIDAVALTHLHPDHIGALVSDGAATFPKATFHVHQTEVDFWTSADNRAGAPDEAKPFFDLAKAAVDAYGERVQPFSADGEVLAGLRSMHLPGHTPGHSGFVIGSGDDALLIFGDIVHVGAIQFAKPEVAIAFETDAAEAIATRKRVFDMAAKDRMRIAGMHIAFPGVGHLKAAGAGYDFEPEDRAFTLGEQRSP